MMYAADLVDPRTHVSPERREERYAVAVRCELLVRERATVAEADLMGRVVGLPDELVREVITFF